jgi:subtilisin family serine protease
MSDFATAGVNHITGTAVDNWGAGSFEHVPSLDSNPGGAPIAEGDDTWAMLDQPLPLAGKRGCTVNLDVRRDLVTDEDRFWIESSTDQLQWTPILKVNNSSPTPGLIGRFAAGVPDGQTTVYLRFRLIKGSPAAQPTRVWLSNLQLRCLADPAPGGGSYKYLNGTSMATPEVTGVAALLLAKNPTLTPVQLRAALLDTVVNTPALAGKTVTGGRVDAARALAAVPPPPSGGDGGGASTGGGVTTSAPQDTPALAPDAPAATPAALTLRLGGLGAKTLRLATVLRRGLRVPVDCATPCRLSGRLTVDARTARRLGFAKRTTTIATGAGRVAQARRTTVALRLTARAKRRLRSARSLRATLRVVATGDGQRATSTRRLRLT